MNEDASEFMAVVELDHAKVYSEVLGVSAATPSSNSDAGQVDAALKLAEKDMRVVMDRLTWWKMVWRVDELGEVVRDAVRKAWCTNLEKNVLILSLTLTSRLADTFSLLAFNSHWPP